jgi:hypothetical protein
MRETLMAITIFVRLWFVILGYHPNEFGLELFQKV